MSEKILLGVEHKNEEELKRIYRLIQKDSLSSVGLELPECYLDNEAFGVADEFFYPLASFLREQGIKVVPLEKQELRLDGQGIIMAMSSKKGDVSRPFLEQDLEHLMSRISPYTAPEVAYPIAFEAEIKKRALKFLDNDPTLNDLKKLIEESNKKREEYMMGVIQESQLDMIIVGDGHAQVFKDKLPDYTYLRSFLKVV